MSDIGGESHISGSIAAVIYDFQQKLESIIQGDFFIIKIICTVIVVA